MIKSVTGAQTPTKLSPADNINEWHGLASVVIIFFNEERFLAEAVASVYAQTFHDWELLLVDDGSSDRSSDIAKGYAERDRARVRYLEHPGHVNRGASSSRNLGVSAARGAWVAFLDGDDIWLPERLERSVALALAHPDADVVYGKTEYWRSWQDTRARSLDYIQPHYFHANRIVRPPDLLVRYLSLRAAYPCMGSLLVRRSAFNAIGGFEESFRGLVDDLVFFAKFSLHYSVYVSDECWDRYRQHAESDTALAEAQGRGRSAQRTYLSWLERYIEQEGVRDESVHRAVRGALRRSDRPPDHWRSRLDRLFRRVVRWRYEF